MMYKKIVKQIFIIVVVIGITAAIVRAAGGYLDSGSDVDGCPTDMVFVPSSNGGFCIDRYEASADEECPYENPDSQDKTVANLNNGKCKAVSDEGNYPWRYLSRNQAAVACAKAGKRLPTNKEWYLASLGTPDGDNQRGDDCQVDKNWDEQPGRVGSASQCKSGAGAYDMIGNVWEWVDGEVENGHYDGQELPQNGFITAVNDGGMPIKISDVPNMNFNYDYFWIKNSGIRGIARGGYWDNKEEAGFYSVYIVSVPSYAGKGIGFRCVR